MRHVTACVGLVTATLSTSLSGATDVAARADAALTELSSQADLAYRARDCSRAAPLYQELTKRRPEGYIYWLRLGACLHRAGQNAPALVAYQVAQDHGAPPANVRYEVATVLASSGERDRAFAALSEAISAGHGRPDLMTSDPDLAGLRGDARFAPLVRQAERNQAPCDYRAESRQFDFWTGDWNVVTTGELTAVGRSHVERTIGNCVIWENWTSLGESGYAGKSYNIYNIDLKRWEQFWVDNQGAMIHFQGKLADGVMDLYTDAIPQADGKTLTRHLRFYNLGPDRVRQLSEGSSDGGRSWTVEYDFSYNRAK